MKKIIVLAALTLACGIGFTTQKAQAADAPAWVCNLAFKGQAKGLKIILGKYTFEGEGNLRCVSALGSAYDFPVALSMRAAPLSPGIALGKYNVYGESGQISLFNMDPNAVMGKYMIAQAHATLLGGVGTIVAVKAGNPHLSLTLSLNVQTGFGVDLALNQLRIEPIGKATPAEPN